MTIMIIIIIPMVLIFLKCQETSNKNSNLTNSKSFSIHFASRASSAAGYNIDDVNRDFDSFIEQKYGRVLDLKFANEAKAAFKKKNCWQGR